MLAPIDRATVRRRIRHRVRAKFSGTAARPRLAVFRSQKHIYVQAVDDATGRTLAHATSQDKQAMSGAAKGSNAAAARLVGQAMAQKLLAAGVSAVVFDRGGFSYHGRVRALAEALREGGLKF
jgi:large subunit ribosomal protein L18